MAQDLSREQLEAAAERGDASAMFELAKSLADENPERSEDLYRRAAELGEMRAAHNLGSLLQRSGNLHGAREWYRRASDLGSDRSMVNLGLLLKETDPDQADELFQRAAALGNPSAMRWQGRRLLESDPQRAVSLLRSAADAGDVEAMGSLGRVLMDDDETKAEAERWLSLAEQHGNQDARYHLALLLAERDPTRSKRLFQACAELGDVDAMLHLIVIADQEEDADTARIWAEKAATLGDPQAADRMAYYRQNDRRGIRSGLRRWFGR